LSPRLADRGKYSKWLTFYESRGKGRRTSVCRVKNNGKWPGNMLIAFHARLRFACQPKGGGTFPCTRHAVIGPFWPGGSVIPPPWPQNSAATVAIRRRPMPKDEGPPKDSRACAKGFVAASFSPHRVRTVQMP